MMRRELLEFLKAFRKAILMMAALALVVVAGLYFDVDKTIIGSVVIFVGWFSGAFVSLLALIGLVPVVGPVVVTVLTLPFFWILNGLGYFVSAVAIKRGYTRDVLTYRVLTMVLLLGVVIGFIVGKLL